MLPEDFGVSDGDDIILVNFRHSINFRKTFFFEVLGAADGDSYDEKENDDGKAISSGPQMKS